MTTADHRKIKQNLLDVGRNVQLNGAYRKDDALYPAYVLSATTTLALSQTAEDVLVSRMNDRLYYRAGSEVWCHPLGQLNGDSRVMTNVVPNCSLFSCTQEGKERIYAVGGDFVYSLDGDITAHPIGDPYDLATYHAGRAFYARKDDIELAWSDTTEVYDFSLGLQKSGFVELGNADLGNILRLMTFDGCVLIVRQFGFSSLHALGDVENFALSHGEEPLPSIAEDTVVTMQGQVLFATSGRVWRGNVKGVKPVDRPLFCLVHTPLRACAFNGCYFLYGMQKNGEPILVCWEVEQDVCYIINTPTVVNHLLYHEGVCVQMVKRVNSLVRATSWTWEGDVLCPVCGCPATLRYVDLPLEGAYTLYVTWSGGNRVFNNVKGRQRVFVRGEQFHITLVGNGNFCETEIEWEVEDGV